MHKIFYLFFWHKHKIIPPKNSTGFLFFRYGVSLFGPLKMNIASLM